MDTTTDLQATAGGAALFYRGHAHTWHAELRRDRTGWRLWSITIPPWCDGYSRCGAPPASPEPSPQATPS